MAEFFTNPLVQSVLVPVAGGFILTGAIRFANGRAKGPLVAGAAVALGFLVGYVLIVGLPPLTPVSNQQKLAYVVAGRLIIGFLMDFSRRPPFYRELVYIVGAAAALYWMALPKIAGGTAWTYLSLVALWIAAGLIGYRLEKSRANVVNACAPLLVAALGLGLVALFGRTGSYSQLAFSLATAFGGFMLWNWPIARYPFGATLLLGGAGALVTIAYALALYTEASPYALAMLLLCFFAEPVARRIKLPAGKIGEAFRPVAVGAVALIPALAAVAVAYLTAPGQEAGY